MSVSGYGSVATVGAIRGLNADGARNWDASTADCAGLGYNGKHVLMKFGSGTAPCNFP